MFGARLRQADWRWGARGASDALNDSGAQGGDCGSRVRLAEREGHECRDECGQLAGGVLAFGAERGGTLAQGNVLERCASGRGEGAHGGPARVIGRELLPGPLEIGGAARDASRDLGGVAVKRPACAIAQGAAVQLPEAVTVSIIRPCPCDEIARVQLGRAVSGYGGGIDS